MKTTLTYEFNDDDLEDKISRLVHVDDAYMVISDFSDHLRTEAKYNDTLPIEIGDYVDLLREKLYEIMENYNIDLNRDFC